jgi:hypothetical protein
MSGQRATNASRYAALAERAQWLLDQRAEPKSWIQTNLYIRDKQRRIIPLLLNWAQLEYYGHRTARDIILKPRQLGFTTLVCGLYFADCLWRPNTTSVLVAHDHESAELIFRIVKLFWERLPEPERARAGAPKYDRKGELFWPKIGSTYYVGTAGSTRFGHGLTISNLHCSEVSRWTHPEESLVGLLEAVPAGGRVVLESTANGMGNLFHDLWIEAKGRRNQFVCQLYVWHENPEYAIPGPPLAGLDAEERHLKERWALTDDQIRWRRQKQRDLRDRFREQYPEDDVTCFLTSGRCCFEVSALLKAQRAAAAVRAEVVGTLPGRDGQVQALGVAPARLLVWKPPVSGVQYVIGADVSEGLQGRDASCAVVLERRSGEQVAELHGWVSPDRFGHLLAALGKWYKLALLGVERNNHGHSTLNALRNTCRYPLLYHHVRYDVMTHKHTPQLGWPTDAQTKPILVDDLAAAISAGSVVMNSTALLDECFTFVTKDNGEQEAQEGKRDDRVIALGIAWQVRKRSSARPSGERPPGW